MKKRKADKYWIPFWTDKWLFGSLRIEFTHEERAIWMDFLALGAKDDGYIRANEELGYPIMQLAGMLLIPIEALEKAIDKFVEKEKITSTLDKEGNHIFYIVKWEKYQFTDRYKRKIEAESSEKEEHSSEKKEVYNIIKHNTVKYNTEEDMFEKLWKEYPKEGRFKKKICRQKFMALVKKGKVEEFKKATMGYANHLLIQKEHNNFDQRVMHLSTWLNNWEEDKERYIGVKYEAKL